MKCILMKIFLRWNLILNIRRNLFYGNVINAKQQRQNKKQSKTYIPAFAPHFESKMQGWQNQVELELKARLMNDRNQNLMSQLSSLKLKYLNFLLKINILLACIAY